MWGQVLVGVAELFERVVKPVLPADRRDTVRRELADGLNDLRDTTLALPQREDD